MTPSKIWLIGLSVVLLACGEKPATPKTPAIGQVFPLLPIPPDAEFVSRAGGPDALQITLRTPAGPKDVAAFYRAVFKANQWKLINEAKDGEGAVILFAQRKQTPLWVRVRADSTGGGSMVDLAGAVLPPDSTKADGPAAGKPTS
ncbi:MAG: hypothetical protein ACJ8DC_08240 [Gemmatimonadales bacterium]